MSLTGEAGLKKLVFYNFCREPTSNWLTIPDKFDTLTIARQPRHQGLEFIKRREVFNK